MSGPLAVFDLDGTLASTAAVDAEAYVEAFEREHGFVPDTDWASYRHCTDPGIAREALDRHFGRPTTEDEMERVRRRFRAILDQRLASERHRFVEIAGASRLLARLSELGWTVRIATGAWSFSAQVKLQAAGLPRDVPLFCSDLDDSREAIVQAAIDSAGPTKGDLRTVSVGDGVWDVRTAAGMGLPFVGVAAGEGAERLRQAGARAVVPDFSDLDASVHLLETAEPPDWLPRPRRKTAEGWEPFEL